jgi:hypothetical protein
MTNPQIVTVQLLVKSTGIETIQALLEGALERLKKDPDNNEFIRDFRIDSGDYEFVAEDAPQGVEAAISAGTYTPRQAFPGREMRLPVHSEFTFDAGPRPENNGQAVGRSFWLTVPKQNQAGRDISVNILHGFDGQIEIEAYPCNSDAGTLGRLVVTDTDAEALHKDAEAEAA